jgi:phosphate transport system substrate-binding protein
MKGVQGLYKRLGVIVAVLVLAVGYAGGSVSAQMLMNGAGATFPYPIYSKWFDEYTKVDPSVRFNYQSIGSGGGIEQTRKRTVDFGASDAPLSDQQLADMGRPVLLIPTVAGSIAISYNVPGIGGGLRLTPENIADIYLGTLTKWSDPRLKANNPTLDLPDSAIVVVHRSDGSGTTFHFTSFLSLVSPEWNNRVGHNTSVAWPAGIGGKGNEGVAGVVKQTPGAVGYVELAYAIQNKLGYAEVKNRDGQWIAPSLPATTAAAAGGAAQMAKTHDVRVSISYAPGRNTYPIAGFTYLLVPKVQDNPEKGKALVKFLWWAIHDGQKYASDLLYASLPPDVVKINEGLVKSITYQGKALLASE